MTTKQLYSKFELLELNLKSNQYLLNAIRSMSLRQNEITDLHSRSLIMVGVHETHNAVDATRNRLREIIQEHC